MTGIPTDPEQMRSLGERVNARLAAGQPAVPLPPRPNRKLYVAAQLEIPLAWIDDVLAFAAENSIDKGRPSRATLHVRKRAEQVGGLPQLRMALDERDTIADYVRALGNRVALRRLRRRAAIRYWEDGGCRHLGGPGPGPYRIPDLPYLESVRVATYGAVSGRTTPAQQPLTLDTQDEPDDEQQQHKQEFMRGPGRQS